MTMAILTTFLALVATLTTNTPTTTPVTFSVPTINFGKFVGIAIVAGKITGKITKKLVFFLHQETSFSKPVFWCRNRFLDEKTTFLVIFLVILLATIPIMTTFLTPTITSADFSDNGNYLGNFSSTDIKLQNSRRTWHCHRDNANSDDFFGAVINSGDFFGTDSYSDDFSGADSKLR
ncbi:hypothetical protein CsatB_024775 [Cannabis sativa]